MPDVSSALDDLLECRRLQKPPIEAEVARWTTAAQLLRGLEQDLADLVDGVGADAPSPLQDVARTAAVRARVFEVIEKYEVLAARFARSTVSIGVTGAARMGKSTLLRSISGLTGQEIPTGEGIPVTAVRSRISHASSTRADLFMHSPESFLSDVVGALHRSLGLASAPRSLEEFRNWDYPSGSGDVEERVDLNQLRDLQASLATYAPLLDGVPRSVVLGDLRPFVAFPSHEVLAREGAQVPRPYAAVREARIACPFPHGDVGRIECLDLPGLGDPSVDERRHVAGLRNEVDAVLLVKRSSPTSSFFSKTDIGVLSLMDEVLGEVRSKGEFVYIVHNVDPERPDLADHLRHNLRQNLNEGQEGRFYTVFETDVRDQARVGGQVLVPLLERLSRGLPIMDCELVQAAERLADTTRDQVMSLAGDVRAGLGALSRTAGVSEEVIEHRAEMLRAALSKRLRAVVARMGRALSASPVDDSFSAAVEKAYQGVLSWIEDGFGRGAERWQADALDVLVAEGETAAFAGPELSRIRVEIGRRFAAIDDFFTGQVTAAWDAVAEAFVAETGALLASSDGVIEADADWLRRFSDLLVDAPQPCSVLAATVQSLLDVRLEYRTLLYPRVRSDLRSLNLQVEQGDGSSYLHQIAVSLDEEGVAELQRILGDLAEQAAYRVQKALLAEAVTPTAVIHAVLEQFEDTLIRSSESSPEFRRFVRAYRNDLWPNEFRSIDEANARYGRASRTLAALTGELER